MDISIFFKTFNLQTGFIILFCLGSVILFSLNWRHLNKPLKWLGYYFFWNLFAELGSRFWLVFEMNNLPGLHIYTLGEFWILASYFEQISKENKENTSWYLPVKIIISLFVIANSIFLQSIYQYNTNAKAVTQTFILFITVRFFFTAGLNPSYKDKYLALLKKINSAFLIYYAGSFFVFVNTNVLLINKDYLTLTKILGAVNGYLNTIFQIFVFFTLWITFRKKK